jgi:hypothetical protein
VALTLSSFVDFVDANVIELFFLIHLSNVELAAMTQTYLAGDKNFTRHLNGSGLKPPGPKTLLDFKPPGVCHFADTIPRRKQLLKHQRTDRPWGASSCQDVGILGCH